MAVLFDYVGSCLSRHMQREVWQWHESQGQASVFLSVTRVMFFMMGL
jgi:hypothetical protein